MKIHYTIKHFIALLFLIHLSSHLSAQSVTFDNVPPFGTGSTAIGVSGGIVFNFTTNKSVILENFRVASTAGSTTATVWYNPTKINGQPVIANMNAAGGWINLGSSSHIGLGNAALATIPVNMNLTMNPGDTFGFFLQFSSGNVFSTSTLVTPTFTNGTVTIIADNDCAFTRNATAWFGPVRQLNGGIIYKLANKGVDDASVSQLISAPKFCGPSQNLLVQVSNKGRNIINNVTVNWSVNGGIQTPITISNPLDTPGHPTKISDTTISLGLLPYLPNELKNIAVWTSSPNGLIDTIPNNDSLYIRLRPGMNGTYTIGSTASDFTTFKGASNVLDTFGKCGPVLFNVTAGETFNTTPITITNLDSITFQRFGAGANPIVNGLTGTGTTADAVFKIAGSKTIVFDGIDVADDVTNSTTTTQMEYGYSVLNSSATIGSSNNVIKNCKITLKRTNTATIGILQSASTTGGGLAATALSGANHNNRYENVKIENSYKGIGLVGTAGFPDSNCVITSTGGDTTIIGSNAANDIGNGTPLIYGINAADQKNVEISKCLVRNLTNTGTTTATQGIFIDNGSTTVDYGTAKVWGNTIHSIARSTTSTSVSTAIHVHGIRIDVSTTAAAQVWNNVVYNITNASAAALSANQTIRGISFGTTTGTGTADFYYNSVSINNPGLNITSVAFWKDKAGTVNVRNNIFSNTSPAQTGVAKHFAAFINVAPIIASNNIYWAPNANGFVGFAAAADRATLPQYAAAISTAAPTDGNDQGSANANPNFTSATSLDFATATPAVFSATPITTPIAITTDILGNTRSTTLPSVGAYETTQPLFDSAAPVITNVFSINSATPSVYATITDNNGTVTSSAGSVQLWYRLGTSGLFSGLLPDSVPSGTMNGTYKWGTSFASLAPGSYQYFVAARDIVGPGLNISVNPIQAATITNFGPADPAGYAANPDPAVTTRTFSKLNTLTSGTYSVGPTGTYAKLTNVAAALNGAELTGNVIFELQPTYDGTTGETFPIVFNQIATVGGNWNVTIRPATGATALQVSGAGATTLIDLNGTKRIRFDGRPGGAGTAKELTFANTNGTGSVFRFINDAQNDTLRYINMTSVDTLTTNGMVFFSTTTGTAVTNGNSNNLLDNCSVNGLSKTTNCIYSSGSASPADNKNNTIINCNIFDFFPNAASVTAVNGILLAAGNSNWNIGTAGNGNNFYQTAIRNSTSTPALTIAVGFRAIQINSATVNGCSIVGNRIGGNIPGIPGSTFVIGDNVGATNYLLHYFRTIDIVAAGITTPISIQGNTISDITLYSGLTGTTAGFAGIHVLSGVVNTGNITGNTIGAPTGTGSINIYYKNTGTGVNQYGIRYAGANSGLIQNNSIGSLSGDAATGGIQMLCMYLSGTYSSAVTVSNNLVGSLTTPHSVQSMSSSLAPVTVMGIAASAAQGAAINITGNTVMNLSTLCALASTNTTNGLKGIYITGATTVSSSVTGNTVRKLYSVSTNAATDQSSAIVGINSTVSGAGTMLISGNTVSALVSEALSGAVNVMGIHYSSTNTGTPNRIERNLVHSLYASSSNTSALVSGITQGSGSAKLLIANNMIRLGFDSTGLAATGPHFITGIQKVAGSSNVTIFNSVNIGGSGVANGVSNSYAYRSNGVGVDSLLNNIFMNTRSNATTGGMHYAVALSANTTLTINRNVYDANATLGQFNAIDQLTLADWRTATTQDLQSVDTTVNFVSNTDLHLTGTSLGNTSLVGTPIAGIPTDFDGQTRHVSFPYIGADESLTFPLPVELLNFSAQPLDELNVSLNWATATETNSSHFEIERSTDGKHFESLAKLDAMGESKTVSTYSYEDVSSPFQTYSIVYYRLKMVDRDGQFEYSEIVSVSNQNNHLLANVDVHPNPFNANVIMAFESMTETEVTFEVRDITGKMMGTFTKQAKAGKNMIQVDNLKNLPSGFYFMTILLDNSLQTIKLIKE